MRFVCISDTHLRHLPAVPEGDVLIHAGDLTMTGALPEVQRAFGQLFELPHKTKIVIAGNHDWLFERRPELARAQVPPGVTYLQDESVDVEGKKVWGSPWQPEFCDWAFNLERGSEIADKWDLIPTDTDILVTHGPPVGHGDRVPRGPVGCQDLLEAVQRVKPRLHVFGHIHEGYGVSTDGTTVFVNASICSATYRPDNAPIVFDWTQDQLLKVK